MIPTRILQRPLAYTTISFLFITCLIIFIGSLYSTQMGVERTINGRDGYSRTNHNWQWIYFDGADFSYQDDLNHADEVRFQGRLWQGAGGRDQWRLTYNGRIHLWVDGIEVFSDDSSSSSEKIINVMWQREWLDLDIIFHPAKGQRHIYMMIYEPGALLDWRLLPMHRLYAPGTDKIESVFFREIAPYLRVSALIFLLLAGLSGFIWVGQHLHWHDLLLVVGLVVVAFILRTIVLSNRAWDDPYFFTPISGSDNYVRMARETLADQSHVVGAFFTPGNTIWLTGIQWLLEPHLSILYFVNMILGSLSIGFIVGAGWLAFGRTAGYLGGFIASFFPFLIFYHMTLQIATPLSVIVAAVMFVGLWTLKWPCTGGFIIFGILLGCTFLLRPTAGFIGLAYALALAFNRLTLQVILYRIFIVAGWALLMPASLGLVNVIQDTGIFLNANGPDTFYWGINRDSNGADHRGQAWFLVPERGQTYGKAALQDIRDQPLRAFELILHKWGLLWGNFDTGNNIDFYEQGTGVSSLLHWLSIGHLFATKTLLVLAIMGLFYMRGQYGMLSFLLLSLVLVTLATIGFTVFGRMRVQIWPMLCIAAGAPIAAVWKDGFSWRMILAGSIGMGVVLITTAFSVYLPHKVFYSGELPPSAIQRVHDFDELRLLGYDPIEMNRSPGGYIYLTLYWEKIAKNDIDRGLFAHIIDPEDNTLIYSADIPVGGVTYPVVRTSAWARGTRLKESYFVPIPEDVPQVIALHIGLFEGDRIELTRIGLVDTGALPFFGRKLTPVEWWIGESIQVRGYDVSQSNEVIQIIVRWLAMESIHETYTLFYHLRDETGAIVTQVDTPFLSGHWTTSALIPDHSIEGIHTLSLPDNLPAGGYMLEMGLYHPVTLERLGTVQVETLMMER